MNEVLLAQTLYLAERLGGVFYDQFVARLDNPNIAEAFSSFASDEHEHARWYSDWLGARGHSVPTSSRYELTVPVARLALAPQPLSWKLRTLSATEALAEDHLGQIVRRVRDPELRSIIEKTIPSEHRHAIWYREEGQRMLTKRDR